MENLFSDPDLQLELLAQAVFSKEFLDKAGDVLHEDDFKPTGNTDSLSWVVANVSIPFFKKNRCPIGTLIGHEVMRWCDECSASPERRKHAMNFVRGLKSRYDPSRSEVLRAKVAEFKTKKRRDAALAELSDLQNRGELTDEKWSQITRDAISGTFQQFPGVLLSEVKPKRVPWLWQNRIPLGHLTTLDGDPATGKTSLTFWIAACVSRGKALEKGFKACSGGVVICSAEDDLESTIQPRLEAAGADLTRIRVIPYLPDKPGEQAVSVLPDDIPILERAIESVKARLVIIDTLSAYLPEKADSYNDKSMRRILAAIRAMANRCGVAVILIRHIPKSDPKKAIFAGIGSIGIIAAARSGFLVARDPKANETNSFVMAHVKANLGPLMPSLGYRIDPVATPVGSIACVEFTGESTSTAADLLRSESSATVADRCADYLRNALAGGPVDFKELAKSGFARSALNRAKYELGIISIRNEFDAGWKWELPNESME